MSFDKKLKELRRKNEMTQKHVAARISVARSTIAGYETKSRQPSHEKLTALANLFHVSIDYLIDDNTIQLDPARNITHHAEEQALLSRYHNLSLKSKQSLMEYMELLELRDKN